MKKYIKYGIILGLILTLIVGLLWPEENKVFNVEMSIKDYGKVNIELDGNTAPITVQNFLKLVKDKFYDGLTFHRIIDGFMMQGGDPNKDGSGGSKTTIKGEFASNGVTNDIKHERGVISMARRGFDGVNYNYDSASSQFFIVHQTSSHLDGEYAAFGRVTSGMDIIDKVIEDVASLGDDNGLIPKDKQPVIEYIKVIDNKK